MAVAAGSRHPAPLAPVHCIPEAPPSAGVRIVHRYTTTSEALHEEPEAGNLHIRVCEG